MNEAQRSLTLNDDRSALTPEQLQAISHFFRSLLMAGKFELKKGRDGQFMFNLRAGSGQVILTSELYRTKASAQSGIASVKKQAVRDANFDRKATAQERPYFILRAANGETLGRSELYSSVAAMENDIASIKDVVASATIVDLT